MANKVRATLSTRVGGTLATITGTKLQVLEVVCNWIENIEDGDNISWEENDWVGDPAYERSGDDNAASN